MVGNAVGIFLPAVWGWRHHPENANFRFPDGSFYFVSGEGDTMNVKTPPINGPPDGKPGVMSLIFHRVD